MAIAVRAHDVSRVFALLGVPANASKAQVTEASRVWGMDHAVPMMTGLRVDSVTRSTVEPSALTVAQFATSVAVRQELLTARPALEVYHLNKNTYAGVTLASLRRIESKISGRIVIVVATRSAYCIQASGSGTTWSVTGPGGALNLRRCR